MTPLIAQIFMGVLIVSILNLLGGLCLPSRKFYFCLLFSLLFCQCASARVPQVNNGEIHFINGKIISYMNPHGSQGKDPILNGNEKLLDERVFLLEEWERVIIIKRKKLYEGIDQQVTVYNYLGNELGNSCNFIGEVVFFEKAKRMLLLQKSAHYITKTSYIYDANGQLRNEIHHDNNIFDYGYSRDEQIFWVLSSNIKDMKPFVVVTIFDNNGLLIAKLESHDGDFVRVQYNNIEYEIPVPEANIPG